MEVWMRTWRGSLTSRPESSSATRRLRSAMRLFVLMKLASCPPPQHEDASHDQFPSSDWEHGIATNKHAES
jgi:hypothetical protein